MLLLLGVFTLALFLYFGIDVTRGGRTLAHLEDVPPIANEDAPAVSIVIPACNEERDIELALASVLAQDYPNFEVIAVNDRSTDATGAILDRMAQANPRLRVIHIRDLPAGWLGKNHALHTGAAEATGSLLLFTDADIVMERSLLRRAVGFVRSRGIDHLAIPPRAIVHGFLSNAFLGMFALGFGLYTQPWKVKDPKSRKYIGIGAFNLVRASAYRAVGGHAPIAMRPDDDMKLGKLLKHRGFRQDMVFGTKLLSVDWYRSFSELRRGLMKNLFAGAEYSLVRVAVVSILQVALLIWPFAALVFTTGPVRSVNALAVLALCVLFCINAGMVGIRGWWSLTIPLGAAITIYLLLRATILTLVNGGIEWRGTRYPLAQLRANRI